MNGYVWTERAIVAPPLVNSWRANKKKAFALESVIKSDVPRRKRGRELVGMRIKVTGTLAWEQYADKGEVMRKRFAIVLYDTATTIVPARKEIDVSGNKRLLRRDARSPIFLNRRPVRQAS